MIEIWGLQSIGCQETICRKRVCRKLVEDIQNLARSIQVCKRGENSEAEDVGSIGSIELTSDHASDSWPHRVDGESRFVGPNVTGS